MTINNDGTISIDKGDIFYAPLFINGGTEEDPIRYSLLDNPNSKVYLSIMYPNQTFENGIIRKIFTIQDCNENGDVVVKVTSRETRQLMQGKYYYQFKLVFEDNTINTITDREVLYVR